MQAAARRIEGHDRPAQEAIMKSREGADHEDLDGSRTSTLQDELDEERATGEGMPEREVGSPADEAAHYQGDDKLTRVEESADDEDDADRSSQQR